MRDRDFAWQEENVLTRSVYEEEEKQGVQEKAYKTDAEEADYGLCGHCSGLCRSCREDYIY